MDKLNTWKTILIGMALMLMGVFLFISHASPTLARLLIGLGVLVELFSVIVFLFGELRRYLRRLLTKRKPTKGIRNTPLFASWQYVD